MKKIVSFVQDIPEKMAEKKEKQEPVKAEKKTPVREQGTRPGISSGAYGKSDEENRLINNLFGDDEPDKKKDRKKKEKQPKEKAPKEKGVGLFGFLKGKRRRKKNRKICWRDLRRQQIRRRCSPHRNGNLYQHQHRFLIRQEARIQLKRTVLMFRRKMGMTALQ